ncbi:MAG TPA: sodium:solute symporter family protein [Phenylobacterium sp.]|jgi:SSS family solute:Na+ symporter|uniref:sodium:solute symporter family protein n=1 Tax=Phenylobacterium sp. TaxID=1871053 RepID=UPI002D233B34|nr:sodium:solute symporter family protein [Phenylobacterium sp.]HZZ70241.1 sodium:solute symporter family protein [Phenylobacterium sp.]
MHLGAVDWGVIALYLVFVLGIGIVSARRAKSGNDFFLAGRAIPAWVCGLAFISANLGAQEVIGMGASGAKYGISTAHFYWIGAIPAMVFIGVFMMPFYYGSKARSAPEYLRMRFDEKTRALNALTFAVMTILNSGISMYALAKLIQTLHVFDAPFAALGLPQAWIFHGAILTSAAVVLVYIYMGGLRGAIYNEVLQFFLIVAGFAPLVWLGLRQVGGWHGLQASLAPGYTHAWAGMAHATTNRLGVDWFGLSMGLGFVLSFGYWCTDFLVVQRAMAANSMSAARRTPLIAAGVKMFIPFIVILPGLIAIALTSAPDHPGQAPAAAVAPGQIVHHDPGVIPIKIDPTSGKPMLDARGQPQLDYDLATPNLLLRYFPIGMVGVGLTALLASFMSGMAGGVTAFNTVFTYDIYQAYIRRDASDGHYLTVGRLATLFGIAASVAAAYLCSQFNNINDFLQLVMAFVNAPVFATFLLGMFWKRTTGHGAFIGLAAGTLTAAIHHGLTLPVNDLPGLKGGWLGVTHTYASEMAQNFWIAIWAWGACFLVTIAVSLMTKPKPEGELTGLVYSLTPKIVHETGPWYMRPVILGVIMLTATVVLNLIFR